MAARRGGTGHRRNDRIACSLFFGNTGPSRMAKKLFGTDGIRGVPGEYPLDDATLEKIGLALGHYLKDRGAAAEGRPARVLLGRDTRESGPHIEELLARGLTATSTSVVAAGGVDPAG